MIDVAHPFIKIGSPRILSLKQAFDPVSLMVWRVPILSNNPVRFSFLLRFVCVYSCEFTVTWCAICFVVNRYTDLQAVVHTLLDHLCKSIGSKNKIVKV